MKKLSSVLVIIFTKVIYFGTLSFLNFLDPFFIDPLENNMFVRNLIFYTSLIEHCFVIHILNRKAYAHFNRSAFTRKHISENDSVVEYVLKNLLLLGIEARGIKEIGYLYVFSIGHIT